MRRTARLVRRALEGRPDPWVRGAADVAAAVARSSTGSRHEGATAAGAPGGVISMRDPSHTAGGLGGADLGASSLTPRQGRAPSRRATSPTPREGRAPPPRATPPTPRQGRAPPRRAISPAPQATSPRRATPCYERPAAPIELKKGKGCQWLVQDHAEHCSLQGAQGGREATENLKDSAARGGQGEHVGSEAIAGPGRGLALAAYHYPIDSSGSTSSSKVCPTIVHDKIFLPKDCDLLDTMSGDEEEWYTGVDVSDEITSCLTQSVGPITTFRLDSSKWTNTTYLKNWLDLLSQRSVKEIDVLNLGHRVTCVFPIDSLQSKDLQRLRIAFCTVILDLLCFNYSSLQILEFFSCTIEGNKLSWVVTDCPVLKVLKVYHCSVDLHIKSSSLQVLECHGNIGNQMVVASSPELNYIACGVSAKQKSAILRQKISASVYISDVPSLEYVSDLSLSHSKILVNTKDLFKVAVPLRAIRLCLSLEMSNSRQLQDLRKLLESFPILQSLDVTRMDDVARDEGFHVRVDEPFKDIGMLDCVKNCLRSFSLLQFRGGKSESHLITCLLKSAPNLIYLSTTRSESTSKKAVRDAINEIKSCDRVSEDCQFSFE